MRNWMSRSYCVAGLLTCFAAGAFATPSLTLVDANANYVMGGVYTSPYNISVNGGIPTLMICDDFLTDIGLGYTWSATISSLTALHGELSPSNQVKFDHIGSPSPVANDTATQQIWDYATAAYLANELTSLQSYGNEAAGENQLRNLGDF